VPLWLGQCFRIFRCRRCERRSGVSRVSTGYLRRAEHPIEPRWVQAGGRWVFYEGYWAPTVAPAPSVVYEPPPPIEPIVAIVAPPAPIVEVRPALPFAGAIWVPGHWHWTTVQYVWLAGRRQRPFGCLPMRATLATPLRIAEGQT